MNTSDVRRPMALVVGRRLLSTEALILPRAVRVCFTTGQSGIGTGFSPSGVYFGFPLLSVH